MTGPRLERAAWFHCYSGVAGDMVLGSLLDAGASADAVRRGLESLGVEGLALVGETVTRAGISATRIALVEPDGGDARRTHRDITSLIETAPLPPRVARRSRAVFDALAEAEARLHGVAVSDVHFHEIGARDCLVEIVGTCLALEELGIERIFASPVAVGRGTVRGDHGVLPHPAPATLRLLEGVPIEGVDVDLEMATPTGVALLVGLGALFGPVPAMVLESSGFGAGSADLAHMPNCVQVAVGTLCADRAWGSGQPLEVLEANLDDTTGEVLGHAIGRLMDAGALDAWVTAATGKKGRPSNTISALATPGHAERIAQVLVEETGTLGVRRWSVSRWAEDRATHQVTVDGVPVRFKVAGSSAKAEYDDLAVLARTSGIPLREAERRALAVWETSTPSP